MKTFNTQVSPQYVALTDEQEVINGKKCYLHEVQKRMKLDFEQLPECTIITAPTGTGKSYAFPFPALQYQLKEKSAYERESKRRGLIVLPTNALINELYDNFCLTYPQLRIQKITGQSLNEMEIKGFNRWKKMIEISQESDLIITNPDIINYAMHGGYHKLLQTPSEKDIENKSFVKRKTGGKEFSNFLENIQYVIFDEYHLYDEAQIANLLTLVFLQKLFLNENNPTRFFFVSATPENGLKKYFQELGMPFKEIIEHIGDQPAKARAIHGRLQVEFFQDSIHQIIQAKKAEIEAELKADRRVLIILNNLREVQELAQELRSQYPYYQVFESTGYQPKDSAQNERLEKAHLIVATNKAEVGVNYKVEYCLMETGKYFQNFVQRFGRVSRGEMEGKVVVCLDSVSFQKLNKQIPQDQTFSYYDFLEKMRSVMQERKFYEQSIPYYMGEYIWCIQRNIRLYQEHNTREYFAERLQKLEFFTNGKAYSRYRVFQEIQESIDRMIKQFPKQAKTIEWEDWWENYRNTYFRFRDSSKIVRIVDTFQGFETEYSLDWVLQHKEIYEIKTEVINEKKTLITYFVGNLKERNKDIQYTVSTIPNVEMLGNQLVGFGEKYDWKKVFLAAVDGIERRIRKDIGQLTELKLDLLKKIRPLAETFTQKRAEITDIAIDE
jgi:CRISPR-associated endonuclease/helicase Cas3